MRVAITGLYAGLIALLALGLAARVVWLRNRHRVGLGDGGVAELGRAIRAHGNLAEYAPLSLLLLLIAELGGALPGAGLHAAGAAFVLGRALHAVGLSRHPGRSACRFLGMFLTWSSMLALSIVLLAAGLRAMR